MKGDRLDLLTGMRQHQRQRVQLPRPGIEVPADGIFQLGSASGNANLNLTLANAGVYKILTQPNKASQCGGNTWAGGTPDDHLTVGIVCDHP